MLVHQKNLGKMITPKECLALTPEEVIDFNKAVEKIDENLRAYYDEPGDHVRVHINIGRRVRDKIIAEYTTAGWTVTYGNDADGDPRDGSHWGGPFIEFTAK